MTQKKGKRRQPATQSPTPSTKILPVQKQTTATAHVERSEVPPGLPYREYRAYLREDFVFSCAYCTMTEFEAQGVRMTIDHYVPKNADPALVNEYSNLMYCCDQCNRLKGDRWPPPAAREDGHRFFRPDHDYRDEHFYIEDNSHALELTGKSNTGEFTVIFLDLNRQVLQRLRSIRQRLRDCRENVVHGLLALKTFPIDQLPTSMKGRAAQRIAEWQDMDESYVLDIDDVLRGIASSGIEVHDPENERRAEERAVEHKQLEGLYPGKSWRARKKDA